MAQNTVDVILVGRDKSLSAALSRAAGNASRLSKALDSQGRAWQRTGRTMQSVGSSLTRWVTIPLAAVGAASVMYAYKYEKNMMKVAGINRQSAKDMAIYRKEMDAMASTTGRGPAELADALYFVTSTGFKGAGAMKILEASAKGAAVGMGDTQVIADSLTTTLAAYEGTGLTAARAMDILTAAIRTGKAEPAEFAARIGDVAANAAHLGVTFSDVAASIAVMTAKGIKTPEAVTSLNNVMLGLTKGTKAGADYLDSVGSSYYKLRKILADRGIVPALKEVKRLSDLSGFKKTDETMKKIIPNIRSLRAVWGLLGGSGARLKRTFDEVKNSAGEAQGTFEIWAKTDVGKLQMGWAKLLVGLKDLGTVLLPGVTAIVSKLAGIGSAFSRLTGPQKSFLVQMGLIAGLAGPAIWALGTMVSSIGSLAIAFSKANLAVKGFGATSGAIKAAFVGGAAFAPQRLGDAAGIVGLSRTSQALNGVSRAAGGARAGFAAVGASILGILGPIGITIAAIAGIGLAIYGVYRLAQALQTHVASAQDMAKAAAKIKVDPKLQAWSDKALGGHIVSTKGSIEWKPNVKVTIDKQAAADSVQWIRTAGAQQRQAAAEEALKTHIAITRSTAQVFLDNADAAKAVDIGRRNAAIRAGKGPGTADPAIAKNMAEYKRLMGIVDQLSGKARGLQDKFKPVVIKANIADLQAGIKKAEAQRSALTKKPWTVKTVLQNVGLTAKIANMKAAIGTLTGQNWKILLTAKIQAAQSNLKTLRAALTQLKNQKTSPKIEAQKQVLEAAIAKAKAKLANLNDQVANPKITANAGQALSSIGAVIGAMARVQSKTVTITTRTTQVGNKQPLHTAVGGVFSAPQVRLIAEAGPEAVIPLNMPARAVEVMQEAGLSADAAPGKTTKASPVGKTVAVAAKAANSVAGAISKATSGLGKKRLARLSNAADASGSIQTLVDFISSISEALDNLNKVTVPALSGQWAVKVKAIVGQAAKVAIVIAKEINKAFPWTKGRSKTKKKEAVDPKMGKQGTKLSQAGEAGGPIGDLLDFVGGISELLTTISAAVIPAASAECQAKARALAKAAAEMARAVAAEINKVFPARTTKRVNKGTKRKPKWKTVTTGGEAADNLEDAGALAGPIGDVLGVITNMNDVLTAITAQTVAMTPELLTKARDMAKAAADVAKAVSEELIKAFPKATTTRVNTGTKKKPKWALVTTGGEAGAALEEAGPLAGPIGDMLGLITGISDTLTMLTTTAIPAMTADVAQKARTLAQAAVQIAQIVQEEINAAFSSEASKTSLADAATTAGPLADVLGVISSMSEALTTLTTTVVPALTAEVAQKARTLAQAATQIAQIVQEEINAVFSSEASKTSLAGAATTAGPLADVLGVISSMSDTLTRLTTTVIPAMTADVAQKARTLAQAAVQIAQIVQEEINAVFSSEASKTALGATAATAGPLGEVLGVAGSALDLLKSMTEVDPRLFEPVAGSFARLGAIIRSMATTFVADLSGIVIPDSVMTAIDRLKLLAEALLSVLDVMRGVQEVNVGSFGTSGWNSMLAAAGGMARAANTVLPGLVGSVGLGAVSYSAMPSYRDVYNAGSGDVYNFNFDGPIYATSPGQAQAAGNAMAIAAITQFASTKRSTNRGTA